MNFSNKQLALTNNNKQTRERERKIIISSNFRTLFKGTLAVNYNFVFPLPLNNDAGLNI